MKLIDADKAYKELIDSIDWLREQDYEAYSAIGDDIRTVLNKRPTEFDVDKVVDELRRLPKCSTWNHNSDNIDRSKAIEIVKGGETE